MAFSRSDFIADIESKLEEVRENYLSESDKTDKAFCYMIAEMFEPGSMDPAEDIFEYTDGKSDHGIDFAIQRNNTFRIYQCKSVEDPSKYPNGKTWGADPVNELAEAVDFMLSNERPNASKTVSRLRDSYQLNREDHLLTAVLAIEGKLSEEGMQRWNEVRESYEEVGVGFRLIGEKEIYAAWHSQENPADPKDITLKLTIEDDRCALRQNDWLCAVLDIEPLLMGIRNYGASLFDLNVRAKLRGSSVNDGIRRTISTPSGQRAFVHLNNGIVITCNNYKFPSGHLQITLNGAQVVNGCQTLSTIWDYYLSANDAQKADLCSNLKILAKIIRLDTDKKKSLLDNIIIASNNQNPMNERNLRSNTREQNRIQASFYSEPLQIPYRYYYIRKDGEFEAFLTNKNRHPRKQWFEIPGSNKRGKNRYRHIDNEQLAKIWWAWIGNGSAANTGGVKFFSDSVYPKVFTKRPSAQFWEAFCNHRFVFNAELLAEECPSPYQFLLAMAISSFISARIKPEGGTAGLKRRTIQKLIESGELPHNADQNTIASALDKDRTYLNESWRSMMTFALTEIASFILVKKYGNLDPDVCKKLISLPDVAFWLEHGCDAKSLDNEVFSDETSTFLSTLFDFIDEALQNFFNSNRKAIQLESRPKLFLSSRDNIIAIKEECLSDDLVWVSKKNKERGKSFFDCLPQIQLPQNAE